MDARAMAPLGAALRSYLEGDSDAALIIRRDDGVESSIPASAFFRNPLESSAVDRTAIELARGRVLDVGAGSGLHSLALQERGLEVTAIDVSSEAVDVMKTRGVKNARRADIFEWRAGLFDTVLMMGHGIGMVETPLGLDRFLGTADRWLAVGGQILLDSIEVQATDDPATLAYHDTNRKAGRYIGEVRVQLGYGGQRGPLCGWLHIDSESLAEGASRHRFQCEVVARSEGPDYLARLTRNRAQG